MLIDIRADILSWLSTILEHWAALATGGILMGSIWLIQSRWPTWVTWARIRLLALVFLAVSILQSWQVEYKSRVGRELDLSKANIQLELAQQDKAYEQRDKSQCETNLNTANARVSELQAAINNQQKTIDTCVVSLASSSKPEKLAIISSAISVLQHTGMLGSLTQYGVVIVQANRPVPVSGVLRCSTPFAVTMVKINNPDMVVTDASYPQIPSTNIRLIYKSRTVGGYGSSLIAIINGVGLKTESCEFTTS